MKLWKLTNTEPLEWDTYDSCVVAAEDQNAARQTTPRHVGITGGWASKASNVRVEYLGEARPGMPAGVVCASFNAG